MAKVYQPIDRQSAFDGSATAETFHSRFPLGKGENPRQRKREQYDGSYDKIFTRAALQAGRNHHHDAPCWKSEVTGMAWLAHMAMKFFRIWPDRWKQRRNLREMDDDRLHDLGISRSEAKREGEKPFWQ